jgi:hypothetical protein
MTRPRPCQPSGGVSTRRACGRGEFPGEYLKYFLNDWIGHGVGYCTGCWIAHSFLRRTLICTNDSCSMSEMAIMSTHPFRPVIVYRLTTCLTPAELPSRNPPPAYLTSIA